MTLDDAQNRTDAADTTETVEADGDSYPTGMLASPTRTRL